MLKYIGIIEIRSILVYLGTKLIKVKVYFYFAHMMNSIVIEINGYYFKKRQSMNLCFAKYLY